MPIRKRRILLAFLGWLTVGRVQAQTQPPAPPPEQVVVRVELPSLVGTVANYAGLLFSKEKNKLKSLTTAGQPLTSNPVLVLTVPVPRFLAGGKEKTAKSPK